jgi:hypothetical protein
MKNVVAWLRRHPGVGGSVCVLLAAVGVLLLHVTAFRLDVMHVEKLNDQVSYITTARWFSETGELRSHTIVPAFIGTQDWRLYMPGHYSSLALSQLVFGAGPVQWRLPNLFAFTLTAVLVYDLGRRLFDVRTGSLAALFVILLPLNVGLAFTAMSGPTFMAMCVLSFWILVCLPPRLRPFTIPFLLLGPFLFREQGALLLVPMSVLAVSASPEHWKGKLLVSWLGSTVTLGAAYAWQLGTGKQGVPFSWLLASNRTSGSGLDLVNYGDATIEIPGISFSGWLSALSGNVSRNLAEWRAQAFVVTESWILSSFVVILLFVMVSTIYGVRVLRRPRFEPYPLAVGAMGLLALMVVLVFHKTFEHVAFKHVSFTFPFTAIAVGALCGSLLSSVWRRLGAVPVTVAVGLLALPCAYWSWVHTRWVANDVILDEVPTTTLYLEGLSHDDQMMLVCPPQFGLDYVLKHYPVRWSFPPSNQETLRLLSERYVIGTIFLPTDDVATKFTSQAFERLRLRPVESLEIDFYGTVRDFIVFQREPEPEPVAPR